MKNKDNSSKKKKKIIELILSFISIVVMSWMTTLPEGTYRDILCMIPMIVVAYAGIDILMDPLKDLFK